VCELAGGGSCDDGRACTADLCEAGACSHPPRRGEEAFTCAVGPLRAPDGPCLGERLPPRVAELVPSAGVILVDTGNPDIGPKALRRLVKRARKLLRKAARATRRDQSLSETCRAQVLEMLDAARRDAADVQGDS
jgi:hypothetical protein